MMTSPAGMDVRDRIVRCLTTLAVCDSLGTTLEFSRPGTFEPVDDMVAGVPLRLEPGQWTNDASMGWTRRNATGAKS
jgi:ADP-ribosyl-[dinitrogen reductase] hydrolase